MSLAPSRSLALAIVLGATTNAAADGDRPIVPDASESDAEEVWTIPPQCAPFMPSSGERPESVAAWRQMLSLAACVQDASIGTASDADQLAPLVEEMSQRLMLPMLIYIDALEHAEAPIQLRAAFQVGMAYVALSVRARSSIAAPPDLATNPEAARRYRELHARLEPLLVPARRAAWVSFRAIAEAAAEDDALATNEVERHMVATARRMLPALRDAALHEDAKVARVAAPAAAPVATPVAASIRAAP